MRNGEGITKHQGAATDAVAVKALVFEFLAPSVVGLFFQHIGDGAACLFLQRRPSVFVCSLDPSVVTSKNFEFTGH